ncbi:ABC transporter ATP-binding protein [Microbacterium aurantiacum]|uniref:ATP-binding cassette domain-containing protein n=1 Tax=Microbacterium aurantiacum TaxID=162393 RepID=A0AAJ2LXR4_9MICO|nr:energy-coupling factor transporter ATPase [Microbacterium aurantiacum]MDS0244663.1 ATP-binding cassette domain-containing protein [Microbacterium aurantiacum]
MTAHPLPAPGSGSPSGPGPLARLRDVAITHEGEDAATPARVSFDVAPGEVVLVLGPSGSGKSTLALAFNGLIPHAVPATLDGSVVIAGLDTAASSVARLSRHVGMVFQDPDAQLVTGTLLDEVAFGPENLRLPVGDVLARAEASLRRVGLWERRSENPDRLSGGGRQRLAIACALAMGSRLMVLDEPTANLDPRGIDEVYEALAEVAGDPERAIVLIEHNLDAAVALVTRVVVLGADGVVLVDGPTDAVLRGDAERLAALGVWLPTSTLAALRLRGAGYAFAPLPLTPDELRAALEAQPAPDAASALVADSSTPGLSPETAGAAIEVRDLTLRRGKTPVLHDVTVDIPRGSFVAVVGANGAGKTTLVQAMAGVLPSPKGTVRVGGHDIARLDERTRAERVGFVFQNPEHQFITASVFEEIAHGLRRTAASEEEVRERATALLERFGLAERAHVHPFLLSGGQKRRLSVGTALVAGAGVLALDEPTFGQDRARAEELLSLLRDLHDDGTTIIVVTHDMQLVADHAERVVVMADGRILADAPTAEVFADPDLIGRAGLRMPPLARALHGVARHPHLAEATRVSDLPGTPVGARAGVRSRTDGIPS